MLVKTKHFGDIELDDNKIITFEQGILGFEDYKKYTIIYDVDAEKKSKISWFQSVEEPGLAMPVISPINVKPDYNPVVDNELLTSIGDITDENLVILLTLNVPSDVTKMTCNLKAPLIINSDTCKGCQIIADNQDYQVKYNVYEAVQKLKEKKGEGKC